MTQSICFYHENCLDGIVAAVNIYNKDNHGFSAFKSIQYGRNLADYPELEYVERILFVDYCPTDEQFQYLVEHCPKVEVWVLDHHKTAWDIIPKYLEKLNIKFYLHQKMSGAGLSEMVDIDMFKGSKIVPLKTLHTFENVIPIIRTESQRGLSPLTYHVQFRDLWTDPNSETHETAACFHDAVEMYGMKNMSVEDAIEFMQIHNFDTLVELGRVIRARKKAEAGTLIKLGKTLSLNDVNRQPYELLITIGNGNMGTAVGEVWCGRSQNPDNKPRVTVVISISLNDNSWVLGVRASASASGLAVVKALCGDEGGGHVQACGGRIQHANDLPLDLFIEELPRVLKDAVVVL